MRHRDTDQWETLSEEPSTIYRIVAWAMVVWLVWAAILFGGCASSRAVSEEKVKSLEREVARLMAERANIDARSRSMDDKIVILEKKLTKCSTAPRPELELEVVRLTPEGDGDMETEDPPQTVAENDYDDHDDSTTTRRGPRPSLKLYEGQPRRPARFSEPLRDPLIQASDRGAFDSLGADDLGVVAADGEGAPSEMEQFNKAYLAYSNKSYDAALQAFSTFIQTHPSHGYADDALYWRGECYLAKGKLLKAIGEFERLARRYPNSEKVPAGLYRIGFVYDKLRDFKTAVRYYFKVVEECPGTDAARRASSRVKEIEHQTAGGIVPAAAKR
jgi:tol-pal system protein YbgF